MTTGILFTARLGSQRLPGKHLISSNGRSFIEWLLLRYQHIFAGDIASGSVKLVLATADEEINQQFRTVCEPLGVAVFFGSKDNIPARHLACADAFGIDRILSIDGDDILCSPAASSSIATQFSNHPEKDIIAVTGLPLGMNSSGYSVSYLKKCLENRKAGKTETGWGRVFQNPDKMEISAGNYSIYDRLRFTLDYPEDAEFFAAVIGFFGNGIITATDEEIIEAVTSRGFDKKNEHLFEQYWENFNSLKAQEESNEK